MPPPEIFGGFFSSPAAESLLAYVLETFPQDKLTTVNGSDAEKAFNNAGLTIQKNILRQDNIAFLAATNSLYEKLPLLSNPGTFKAADIVSEISATN